jgi:hypothetical protein
MYTEVSVQDRVKGLKYQSLPFTFVQQFIDCIKPFVFCTDVSRNKIVIKRENNALEKLSAEAFVLECFSNTKIQILAVLGQTISHYIRQKDDIPYLTYTTTMEQLATFKSSIINNTINDTISDIAKQLIKISVVVSK